MYVLVGATVISWVRAAQLGWSWLLGYCHVCLSVCVSITDYMYVYQALCTYNYIIQLQAYSNMHIGVCDQYTIASELG